MTIDSFYELYSHIMGSKEQSNLEFTDTSQDYEINNVYFITKTRLINPASKGQIKSIIGKLNETGLELLEINIPKELENQIEPLHELYSGKTTHSLVSAGNRGVIPIKKYNIEITVSLFSDVKKHPIIELKKLEEISEEKNNEKLIYDILKNKPYLAGFIGIYGITIPLIIENSITLSSLINVCGLVPEPISTDIEKTFTRKISVIETGKSDFPELIIPSTIGKKKAFYIYDTPPRTIFNFVNKNQLLLGGYLYKNETKLIIGMIKTPEAFFTLKNNLNIATFVTPAILKKDQDDIIALIHSNPIDQTEFEQMTGLSIEYLNKALYIFGQFLKLGVFISDKNHLKIITETKEDFNNQLVRDSLIVGISFVEKMIELNKYKELTQLTSHADLEKALKFMIENEAYSLSKDDLNEQLQEKYANLYLTGVDAIISELIKKNILSYDNETKKIKVKPRILELI
jgi:hypothetical protein